MHRMAGLFRRSTSWRKNNFQKGLTMLTLDAIVYEQYENRRSEHDTETS
jgi:hypothetical protein